MAEILLCTINAKYLHASLGLRFLRANLGDLRARARILEVTAQDSSDEIAERILREGPRIVAFGVYIWNTRQTEEVVALLKQVRPELLVVLGGPEISHEVQEQPLARLANHVICGEGEVALRELCAGLLADPTVTQPRLLVGGLPDLDQLTLPYELYDAEDVAHRMIYVESTRGCPFGCEFCLSSLDERVRRYPLEPFLAAMQNLLDRGVRHFKFVDRTFNIDTNRAASILRFFLDSQVPDLSLHFEMIPDRLPDALRTPLAEFPAGMVQLEVGLQSFSQDVVQRIGRRQDSQRAEENIRWLRDNSGAHLHTDLIVGLPGEDMASFALGFDRLVALRPQEIQVGILKRLRGAPIARHTEQWQMVYRDRPPYDVLHTQAIDYPSMQRLKRFAHAWSTVVNNGRFPRLAANLLSASSPGPFARFMSLSDWIYDRAGRVHSISLDRLSAMLLEWGVECDGWDAQDARAQLAQDYEAGGRRLPAKLRPAGRSKQKSNLAKRQTRHLVEQ